MPMTTGNTAPAKPVCALLNNYSIEMTAKDVPHLEAAADIIPQGTKIPVTFLPGETFEMRIAAAKRVRDLGFLPIPHISARRLQSREELDTQASFKAYLEGLGYTDCSDPKDRGYMMSVYFRTPSGTLFEAAYLYGGGFLKDEPVETLGTQICTPPWLLDRRDEFLSALEPIVDCAPDLRNPSQYRQKTVIPAT